MVEATAHRLKGVYVARTTETSQPRFESFLKNFGKSLGFLTTVRNIASTHVTLLESRGVKSRFYDSGFTPQDVRQFSVDMQRQIDKVRRSHSPIRVQVDPEQPFHVGIAQTRGKLALSVASEQLQEERGIIEAKLTDEFGTLPEMNQFDPHITIGRISTGYLNRHEDLDPNSLIPDGLTVPSSVALNGLSVYLGGIHNH
ncbi:MAG: hypothetical protein ACREHG_07990 [Candidatus Saccharimonadales bacterium]